MATQPTTPTTLAHDASSIATGVFFVHSCPHSLTAQVEWVLARELERVVKLDWSRQTQRPDTLRAVFEWQGPAGTAAALTSALFGERVLFEITEDATPTQDGGRWMHTPNLGVFHLQTDSAGNGVLSEHVVRDAIARSAGKPELLREVLGRALGEAWDREIEPLRAAEAEHATIFLTAS